MVYQAVFAAVLCIAVFEIIYWVKFTLKTPVSMCTGTKIYCVVSFKDTDSAQMQRTVDSILYLKSSGILRSTVVVDVTGMDEEMLRCARVLAKKHDSVTLSENIHI